MGAPATMHCGSCRHTWRMAGASGTATAANNGRQCGLGDYYHCSQVSAMVNRKKLLVYGASLVVEIAHGALQPAPRRAP